MKDWYRPDPSPEVNEWPFALGATGMLIVVVLAILKIGGFW